MSVEKIDTQEGLREWIKEELGAPCLHVEMEDSVIETKIDDAIKLFSKHSGDASYRTAMILNITAGENEYIVDDNIDAVINLNHDQGSFGGGIDSIFTPNNLVYTYEYGFGLAGITQYGNENLTSWKAAMEFIEQSRNLLRAEYFLEFNKYSSTLTLTPKPARDMAAVLEVYSNRDFGNSISEIYDEEWVKSYSLALCKIITGRIRSKFQGTPLPGGGSLDGEGILSEGITERDKLKEDLINEESEPLEISVG